jgi:hypothetical protein
VSVGQDAGIGVSCAASSQIALPASRPGRTAGDEIRRAFAMWIKNRKMPLLMTLISLAAGMALLFGWGPVIAHKPAWATGQDLWGTFRSAHYVGWGDVGGIYTPGTGFVSFPGMPMLLAPVAMLSSWLHLTESFEPYFLARPTAALLLQPIEVSLTCTVIFACDALAQCLNVSRRRRNALCVVVAVLALPVGAAWGHAEDALAMTFAIYSLLAMYQAKWKLSGWLMGFGIVMQPLVGLLLPLMVAAYASGRRMPFFLRSVAISFLMLGVAFLGNGMATYQAVVQQPTSPLVNHATPWLALAPTVARVQTQGSQVTTLGEDHGRLTLKTRAAHPSQARLVSGGLGRSLYLVSALLLGLYVWKRPQDMVRLVWLCAVILAARCFFEAVMCPYYLAPPLFLGLIMSSRRHGRHFWMATIIALGITVYAYFRLSPWVWWTPIIAGLAVVLALGYPGPRGSSDKGRLETALGTSAATYAG